MLCILYILAAVIIWVTTTFCWAFGLIGYQFKKWYHWSSLSMYGVAFIQPILWALLGYHLFFRNT